jgi:hypothetical protein
LDVNTGTIHKEADLIIWTRIQFNSIQFNELVVVVVVVVPDFVLVGLSF